MSVYKRKLNGERKMSSGPGNSMSNKVAANSKRLMAAAVFIILFSGGIGWWLLPAYRPSSFSVPPSPFFDSSTAAYNSFFTEKEVSEIDRVLQNASMGDKSVIITTINKAWAKPNSILDLFLESFQVGEGTQRFLNHLVIICLDYKAYEYCLNMHPHCYAVNKIGSKFSQEAYFMTQDYLEMMWRRIHILTSILEMGYNFIFTDADIMWLRDPFPRFYPKADLQIACDYFRGNSYSSTENLPNGGFIFVRSNNQTIRFYKFWYLSRKIYPGLHDQDVFNKIKYHPFLTIIGLRIRFLDTTYFGGFCEPSKDLNKVCTMHANCCYGLANKFSDLKLVLQDWRKFLSLPSLSRLATMTSWSVPFNCM